MKPIDRIIDLALSPGRYLPLELNARKKDFAAAELTVALAFPDLYEVGMSHLGLQILYHRLNDLEWVCCDRAYAPWPDMEKLLRGSGVPLCSHEAGRPLSEFDVIGFSFTYELGYANALFMLELGGVPVRTADRAAGRWPLVIAGGPCASNPEPMAPFIDAFLFGDGEEAVVEIALAAREAKRAGASRDELLLRLAGIEGVYVPSLYEVRTDGQGMIVELEPKPGAPERVRRRIVAELETAYFPERPLTPLIEPAHDRLTLEIARGCARGCRFCQAGIINRPVRERSLGEAKRLARVGLRATGYEQCSLLSLSAGDYSGLAELIPALIREHYAKRVAISLPSLRVAGLTGPMLAAIETVRKTGATLAPEAGTDRLRRVINKDWEEEELLETARRLFEHGWRHLKLYFMVGLPTETDADVEAILELAEKVARVRGPGGRPVVSTSISGFVPKSHTPFQWEAQIGTDRLLALQARLRDGFRGKGKKVKWQNARMSELEGVMARGDRRVAEAIFIAHRLGARFDGWTEQFEAETWQAAFRQAGIDPSAYLGPRDPDRPLPWRRMDPRVDLAWLLEERARAMAAQRSPDCGAAGCVRPCGVCDDQGIQPRLIGGSAPGAETPALPTLPVQEIFFRYRVKYARRGDMRFMGQLEVTRLFNRTARRADLPLRFTQGHHPQPRVMFGPAPPVGVASEAEYIELELLTRLDPFEVMDRLNRRVPEGIEILETKEISARTPALSAIVTGFDYVATASPELGVEFDPPAAERFLARESFMMIQKREKGDREVDVRSRVKYLRVTGPREVELGLKVLEGPGVKPTEALAAAFGLSEDELRRLLIVRTASRFKEAKPTRFPARPERKRKVRGPG